MPPFQVLKQLCDFHYSCCEVSALGGYSKAFIFNSLQSLITICEAVATLSPLTSRNLRCGSRALGNAQRTLSKWFGRMSKNNVAAVRKFSITFGLMAINTVDSQCTLDTEDQCLYKLLLHHMNISV